MPFEKDETTTQLLRENKASPLANNIPETISETWFLQRIEENPDGSTKLGDILAMDEASAWYALQPSSLRGFRKPRYKIIGVSHAEPYLAALKEARATTDPDHARQRELRQQILREGVQKAAEEARGKIKYPHNPNIRDFNGEIQRDPRVLRELSEK